MTKKEILLTPEQKKRILKAIEKNKLSEDRDPKEVIADVPYNGNEEKYLREMAHWYKVAL
jgi:hypothetical protein